MTVITTRITVGPDGAIAAATSLPAGEYIASIEVPDTLSRQLPTHPFEDDDLPLHDFGPWPAGLSLRREDMYADDGR